MRNPVLISLSSFGAAEVRRHGQLWFARLAAEAGADGIEVRAELLADPDAELPAIAQALPDLLRVYSTPEPLCTEDGAIDLAALDRAIQAAQRLEAPRLKMSLGHRARPSADALHVLRDRLAASPVELLIENDQTVGGGTLDALHPFLTAADAQGLSLGLTFDIGNWHWTGECPRLAAQALASRVRYVHCKGVQRQPQRWAAVPMADSAAAWRPVLRTLPGSIPWAIEYPLVGEDLLAVTCREILFLRSVGCTLQRSRSSTKP
ncbi:MAG: sugar phosphate isomerase/epimerase family protein [Leptothrix sp. (in: b-proteobacteria)]